MSTQLTVSNSQTGHNFFRKLPDDVIVEIYYSYLHDHEVVASNSVCKNLKRDYPQLEDTRVNALAQLRFRYTLAREVSVSLEYPASLVDIFKQANMPIFRLPRLDLGEQMGDTGYIDFLEPEDLPKPVMRFHDCLGRPGLAVTICANKSITGGNPHKGVFTFFRKGTFLQTEEWRRGESEGASKIHYFYRKRHETSGDHTGGFTACQKCPCNHTLMLPALLLSLLKGEDPDFSLAENTGSLK